MAARLKALSRRSVADTQYGNVLRYDDLKLDLETKMVRRQDKQIKLSAKEFSLLEYFIRSPERVIPRTELAEKIWNLKFDTGTNVVEVYMNMLRNKIDRGFDSKLLHTRIGMGYVLSSKE